MNGPANLSHQELLARMELIMCRMPGRTREIFMAHRLDHMSYEDIARRTGLTTRQVEKHLARALVQLDRGLYGNPGPRWRFW
jgi:RNA polymerase sigma factor (sigma-70 family)